MAQDIIDIGPQPNDGQGDNLRTAFDKTNDNFNQIWTAGPVGSNIRIAGNVISTLQVNQDLALSPNGTGNIRLNNNTIPGANNTWFLGSATNRWRGLYAASVETGNITITGTLTVPGDAVIQGNLTVEGDTIQIGNIVTDTKTIQLANTAANAAQANGSGITVGASDNIATFLYNSTSNSWVTNLQVTYANGQPIGKLPGGSNTYIQFNDAGNFGGNANFTYNRATGNFYLGGANLLAVAGNNQPYILQVPGLAFQGGSAIMEWDAVNQHVDVSNSFSISGTLQLYGNYPGDGAVITTSGGSGVDITIEPSGNLYLNADGGEVIVSDQTASINPNTGALKVLGGVGVNGNINVGGNITGANIAANYFVGDGSQLSNLPAILANSIENVNSNVTIADPSGNVTISANTQSWTFDTTGNLCVPANGTLQTPVGSNGNINLHPDGTGIVTVKGNAAGALLVVTGDEINSFNRIEIDTFGNGALTLGGAFTGRFARGNLSAPAAVQADDRLAAFSSRGYDGTAYTGTSARITMDAVGNWSPSSHGTHISFWTTPQTSTISQEVARFYANGDYHQIIGSINTDAGNINAVGNISAGNINVISNISAGGWTGNLIPSANAVYSLGNSTNYWANLWVANNTIYIGGVPLGIGAGNVLTVGGNAVLQNDSNTTISTTGNITADYFFGNGSQLTGLNTSSISNGSSNVDIATANGNITVTANGSSSWTFDTTGNLITSSNLVVGPGPAGGSSIRQYDSALQVVGEGANAIMVMGWAANTNAPDSIAVVGFNTPYTNGASNVQIAVGNNATVVNYWTFGTGGTTQFPNSVILAPVSQSITMQSDQYSQLMWQNANVTVAPNMAINSNFYVAQNNATLDIAKRDGSGTQVTKSWYWNADGTLTLPTAGRINFDYLSISSDANVSAFYAPAGNVQLAAGIGDAQIVANSLNDSKTWTFGNTGNLTAPGNISAVGNVTAGNLIATGNIVLTGSLVGSGASPAPSLSGFSSISTTGATGNITASGNVNGSGATFSGNVTAQNFIGNISITGNVQGTSANVTLVAGAYSTVFDNTGNLTLPGNTFAVNYANNTPVDVVTRFESSWTVPTGNSTQSFTVTGNNSYQMWVEGNIPNGIIVWNATGTVTNTNVPVIGQQFAWNYEGGGNILMFTSIPAQIIGTAGAISNAQPAVANTNVFSFGINNTSGGNVTVRYGWIQIS